MKCEVITWPTGRMTIWTDDAPPAITLATPSVAGLTVRQLDRAMAEAPTAIDAAVLEERWEMARQPYTGRQQHERSK